MPNYSMKCAKCDHRWDDFMSISEREAIKCPKCGGDVLTDYSNRGGHVLITGNGFYDSSALR